MFSHQAEDAKDVKDEDNGTESVKKEEDDDSWSQFAAEEVSRREGRTMQRRNADRNVKRLRDLSISCT